MTTDGAWSEYTSIPASSCFVIPESMSFEDAAAIPITYLTAYLMLFHCCNLGARKSVLIHMAAGGVVRKTALYLVKVDRYLYLSPGKEYYLSSRFHAL